MLGTLLLALTLAAYALAMTIGRGISVCSTLPCWRRPPSVSASSSAPRPSRIALNPAGDVPRSGSERQPRDERSRVDGLDGNTGGRAVLSFSGARARRGARWDRAVDWPTCRRANRSAGRLDCGPNWRTPRDCCRVDRNSDRVASSLRVPSSLTGYIVPLVVITVGYALFQTANNTAVMKDVPPDQRGVISGLLNLSRNLGHITGASAMGAVFASASATTDITTAHPEAVAFGMRVTFTAAAVLIVVALIIAIGSRAIATRPSVCPTNVP